MITHNLLGVLLRTPQSRFSSRPSSREFNFSFLSNSAFTPCRNLLRHSPDHGVQITRELSVLCKIVPAV